jgi:DNA-binding MarR family transcriptional regulator
VNESPRTPLSLMAMLHIAHAAENDVEAKLSEIGLTLATLFALRALAEAGEPVPLGQLAGRLSCVKSNVTQLIDRLEADGLVARTPDPGDRRTKLATLTAAGRRACDQATRIQQEAEREFVRRLSRDEARQLAALLSKVGSPAG